MLLGQLDPIEAHHVAALLDEALDRQGRARERWMTDLTGRDPALATLVASLLAAMASSARPETAELVARGVVRATAAQADFEGRRVGPYRVLRLLGRGGMGSVWLARRADGRAGCEVALKLPHPGVLDGMRRERFARERHILGALAHPHIARLLDAGFSADGQPYLALEYVRGLSLIDHCNAEQLSLRARVRLMLQALDAVQYAHQNRVVHRDLKPSNILVGADGQLRLLDFGIAKLMHGGLAAETEITLLGGRALTPDYASPEQIAGRPVGTASDVFSLGVLMYQLLCGRRPHQGAHASRAALEEAILNDPPQRPSRRVMEGDDGGAEVALQRASTPGGLKRELAGDLDTIVLESLKKEAAERYPSADAMRQDLQRWLAGEPVLARPEHAFCRAVKGLHRQRPRLGTGLASFALLAAVAGVSVWQATAASAQAQRAEQRSRQALAMQDHLRRALAVAEGPHGAPNGASPLHSGGAERQAEGLAGDVERAFAGELDNLRQHYPDSIP